MNVKKFGGLKTIWLLGVATFLVGCDAVVPIEGVVATETGLALEDCEAVLYLKDDDRELGRASISGSFKEAFTVYPVETYFYVEVSCEGYSTYRSEPFFSSGQLSDLTALGTIELEPLEER